MEPFLQLIKPEALHWFAIGLLLRFHAMSHVCPAQEGPSKCRAGPFGAW